MTPADIDALLDDGPSRELDDAIYALFKPGWAARAAEIGFRASDNYTTSVDACLRLIAERFEGWEWELELNLDECVVSGINKDFFDVRNDTGHSLEVDRVKAPSPALAMCRAIVAANRAREGER